MSVEASPNESGGPDAWLARIARMRPRPVWQTVLIGLGWAAVALMVRAALSGVYGNIAGVTILLPGVILAALMGGRVGGSVAAVAALLGTWVIAGPDALGVGILTPMGRVSTVNFLVVALFATFVAASLRKTLGRLDDTVVALGRTTAQADRADTRLRDISDVAPVMLWTADADGNLSVNAAFQRFWGDRPLSVTDPDLWLQAVHPEDRDRVLAASLAALANRGTVEIEARYRDQDGGWRTLATRAVPRLTAEGGFDGIVGANIDVTDIRRAEAELVRSEARFRTAVAAVRGILWTNTPDGRMQGDQPGWSALTGQTREDYEDYGWTTAVHPEDVQPTLDAWTLAVRDQRLFEFEHRLMTASGAYRTFAIRAVPTIDEAGQVLEWVGVHTDVSDARAAESALRESEERFRLMADTAPSPVWLTNAEGSVEFVNAALVAFYGKPAESFLGLTWKATVHPDDIDAVNAIQATARQTNVAYGFECRFIRHDGVWRWMRVSVNPRFDGAGAFQGYVGLSFDVTETREALEALASQAHRQRFLLELTDGVRDLVEPDAIMDHVHSVLGRMLGASRVGHGEMTGGVGGFEIRRDWTQGAPSLEGWHSNDAFRGQVDRQLAVGQTVVVHDVATDERTAGAAERFEALKVGSFITVPLLRSGVLRAFLHINTVQPRLWSTAEISLVEDVAERAWTAVEAARAKADLAESEARFRAIADTAPVLIWVTNADRTRAFVNQAYVDYLGGDYESVRTADWRSYIHPDDQARLVQDSIAGEATGQPFALEARYRHHDGEYRWLRSFSRPRLTPTGEVVGFVGVAFDVTDARRVEQDLKRINELLEDRVGEALAEKAKAEADLMHAQRMEAVGRLTGGVAHDFNNLLTVVIGALDLILKAPEDAARRQKLGEAALSAARRGERLTHQLLAFSRRQALRPEAIDLNALIRESDPLLKRAVGEAVSYKLKLRRGGARVIVDPAQFEAALLNLIVNARDAVADRAQSEGATITVQTETCAVEAGEVADLAPGDYICVTVSDTGSGMDAETARRVFEPFFTTKSVGKGTGLGLSQVYGFARQSGGGVKVSSVEGEGSEICLYLPPVTQEAAPAPAAPAPAGPALDAGQRLLLVEDDAGVSAIAVDLISGMGLSVVAVENADAALNALASAAFDVMLTDIVMPGSLSGIDLARRAAQTYPAMRIVLTSGYVGDDVDEALTDAPWPFVAKPYSIQTLAEALGRAISRAG